MLQISGLTVAHEGAETPLPRTVTAVAEHAGVALVGPSGAGKNVDRARRCSAPAPRGRDRGGRRGDVAPPLRHRTPRQRRLLGHVAQDSSQSLDPRRPVGEAIVRSLGLRDPTRTHTDAVRSARARVVADVGIDEACSTGGRATVRWSATAVCVARALSRWHPDPVLVCCDEATASLDDAAREHLIESNARLRDTQPMALVVITHDDEVARASAKTG